ncbi:threonine synthase [Buchnera aphidicola str. Bp (Baizongia pistaciae)]|uniref:Threonine synthase n=1 Tax=Buchnera aphidicola subsp. Baizongia pistaciae (strain Bp) TaxID=224915 RepID=THRC_BUCBP|nr:threonine synthase [Buchnera aphidicola]Q89AR5.1 RecName: Full=Threonine synthase; Short=TS [Buchnera aphidicola str. Bp (Baizongia pistaciae)]AAO26913.1 threonine synthase [Buchnera aphidicola str. Bp (Baizongia pistaciae)]
MKLYNLKKKQDQVNFSKAVKLGLGKNQGLFFPKELPILTKEQLYKLLKMDFLTRSSKILSMFIGDEIHYSELTKRIKNAFSFTTPKIVSISKNIACFELFHGPTLAFKDFGARFMAQILSFLNHDKNDTITILTATSGDTGAAVAHAFFKMKNVRVIILYPKGKISELQEKLFCTLGENIITIAVNGSFDECQKLVKQAFNDDQLRIETGLNSANSINISRLLAQICYYFEAFALLTKKQQKNLVISVPCGNFGNLTAGLLAKALGLPIKSFIASTNSNDTVPRFLKTGFWKPNNTVSTISNAMDISQPNNWPRVEELFKRKFWSLKTLKYGSVSDILTKKSLKKLAFLGYVSEPHAAVAYYTLKNKLKQNEFGLFLGTAHPAKFKKTIEKILQITLFLPSKLRNQIKLPLLSHNIRPDFSKLKKFLLEK